MNFKSKEFTDAVNEAIDKNQKINQLIEMVSGQQADISTLKTDGSSLKSDVAILKSDMVIVKGHIETLDVRTHHQGLVLESIQADIKLILEVSVSSSARIEKQEANIHSMENHEGRIKGLEFSFTQHIKDRIAHNRAKHPL